MATATANVALFKKIWHTKVQGLFAVSHANYAVVLLIARFPHEACGVPLIDARQPVEGKRWQSGLADRVHVSSTIGEIRSQSSGALRPVVLVVGGGVCKDSMRRRGEEGECARETRSVSCYETEKNRHEDPRHAA